MTKLIVVCGLPGTGKTTFSNLLSEKMGIFCLHKDAVKETLYDAMKMTSLNDSRVLGFPSVKTILNQAEDNLKRGIDVILESPFNFPDEGVLFTQWIKDYNLDFYAIVLRLDKLERVRRFTERERHWSHHDSDRLFNHDQDCDYSHMPEKIIFIDSSKPAEDLINEVISYLS